LRLKFVLRNNNAKSKFQGGRVEKGGICFTKSADQSVLAVDDFQLKVSGMIKELFILKDT